MKYYLYALAATGTILLGAYIATLWFLGEPAPWIIWVMAILFCAAIVNECVMQMVRTTYRPEDFT
jgi:hypothetical protein